jgi:UDPglucose 6-dehydrogenase
MKVTVFGTGYVGLVTAVCLAELGHQVVGVDTDQNKINLLKEGKSPIYENGMEEMLTKNLSRGTIQFTNDAKFGVEHGDYHFIAVGTPSGDNGAADLRYVISVARTIGKNLNHSTVIVNKSTVPVGTGKKVQAAIEEELKKRQQKIPFDLVSNPEFLSQGDAVRDFMESERIIIGYETESALNKMKALYAPLKDANLVMMDIVSAELSKYAANACLATKISFINEIARLADHFGANIDHIKQGIGSDHRIGMAFLNAGVGYGGSCFPKDVKALIYMAEEIGLTVPLFEAVENINHRQKHLFFNMMKKYFNGSLEHKKIALWGLAFKPNTDDMREAPSRVLLEMLWKNGATVKAYDPVASKEAEKIYGKRSDFIICTKAEDALKEADVLVVVTEWDEFKNFDLKVLAKYLSGKAIFDGRNIYLPQAIEQLKIKYYGIGRGKTL